MRTVIVGAGISGLAAALATIDRAKERGERAEVVVLEASERAGGAVGSETVDGFVIERGADGFLTEKRAAVDLASRLGIASRLVRTLPAKHGAWIVKDGALHAIPEGFSMMAPSRLRPILRSPILSLRGKLRMLAEIAIARKESAADESLASFVRRRFGDEVLERLAQPLVSGIYGADPETLSLRATMPRFLDEESRSRSLTLSYWKKAHFTRSQARAMGARYGLFASFDRGMQVLVDALVAALPEGVLRLRTPVTSVARHGGRFRVRANDQSFDAERLVLAIPARDSAKLLSPTFDKLASELAAIPFGSVATVVMGFGHRALGDRDGYGIVVPAIERRKILAATFLSRKWPGRAPEGKELVRVFVNSPELATLSDDDLVATSLTELRALAGLRGEPSIVRVRRWIDAMPQYVLGHLDRVARIEALARDVPGLRLAGNSLRGVGIPDAIASGQRAAD